MAPECFPASQWNMFTFFAQAKRCLAQRPQCMDFSQGFRDTFLTIGPCDLCLLLSPPAFYLSLFIFSLVAFTSQKQCISDKQATEICTFQDGLLNICLVPTQHLKKIFNNADSIRIDVLREQEFSVELVYNVWNYTEKGVKYVDEEHRCCITRQNCSKKKKIELFIREEF